MSDHVPGRGARVEVRDALPTEPLPFVIWDTRTNKALGYTWSWQGAHVLATLYERHPPPDLSNLS